MLRTLLLLILLFSNLAAGEKPSEVTLRDLDGKKVHLSDYRGKIVVMNFWATWCGPCRQEMPMLVELEKTWAAKGVTFIAISLDDGKSKAKIPEFLERFHVNFTVWTGASGDELDKLKLGQGVPDTAFVNEEGVIVARVLGEIRREELEERLKWLTGDRKDAPPVALVSHM